MSFVRPHYKNDEKEIVKQIFNFRYRSKSNNHWIKGIRNDMKEMKTIDYMV